MEEFIWKELNQIEELEQRKILKKVLEQILLPFYENNQQMYQELEKKIRQEIVPETNQYDIFCTLIKQEDFILFGEKFSPILEQDLQEQRYEWKDDGLLQGMRIFLECDYLQIKEIIKQETIFSGTIKTKENLYQAEFSLRLSQAYIEEVYHLYQIFLQNNILWKTVFAPYIFKMADVFLVKIEGDREEISEITEVNIDFRGYEKYIKYHVFPIWNIKRKTVGSVGFAMPCEEYKTYQHRITIENFSDKDGYLIENKNYEIQDIQRQQERVIISCNTDEVQEWNIYQICELKEKINALSYPLFNNRKKDSFADKLSKKNNSAIRTKAELVRFLESFEYEEYLEFETYEIQTKDDREDSYTYSVNPFILDEIRHRDRETIFQITMRAKKKNDFLTRDVLSFLVSELQFQLPEYECRGRLV